MKNNRLTIYLAGFLFYLPIALSTYINSSFISSFVGEKSVGIIYILGSIGSLIALLVSPKIFRKTGSYKFLLSIILINAIAFISLAFTQNIFVVVSMFIIGFSMNTLIIFALDEILKIFSKTQETGKIVGAYLAICSSAWIVAQLASGTVLGGISFRSIYLIGSILMMGLFLIIYLRLKKVPDPKYDNINNLQSLKEFFLNKNLSRIYIINFLLQFFFSWMIIYTPIYLASHIGFSWKEISIIFTFMLLPFSFIPFSLGKYADKFGERNTLILGFIITSFSTITLFFIENKILWVWALLLFFTRVGAATVQSMADIYFFKHIKPENEEFVGIYRNASPVAFIFGPLLATIVFIFIPSFNFIYAILGALMLSGVYLASTIDKKDI